MYDEHLQIRQNYYVGYAWFENAGLIVKMLRIWRKVFLLYHSILIKILNYS